MSPISDDLRAEAYAAESRLPLVCLEISHATDLPVPIRVVNNTKPVTLNGTSGEDYLAFAFELTLPDQLEDSPPTARLRIDNVSREIGDGVRAITTPATVRILVVRVIDASTDPVLVEVEVEFPAFRLTNVTVDALTVDGQLIMEDLIREPFPAYVFSPAEFPGLIK